MLSRWKPINSNLTNKQKESPSNLSPKAVRETSEHREHRLRQQYETSLQLHQQNKTLAAKRAFEEISQDLYQTAINRQAIQNDNVKRFKKDDTPLWERRLRYSVHRNLAEVHEKLKEYPAAVTAYSRALSDDPSDFLIWIRTGRCAANTGHLHIARRALEIAKILKPNHWLCQRIYKDVLDVVGDADEDISQSNQVQVSLSQNVSNFLQFRQKTLEREIEKSQQDPFNQPQLIEIDQLSWDVLVTQLLKCFQQRLNGIADGKFYSIGHAVTFQYPHSTQAHLVQDVNSSTSLSSDDIQVISETNRNLEQVEDVIIIQDDDFSAPLDSTNHEKEKPAASVKTESNLPNTTIRDNTSTPDSENQEKSGAKTTSVKLLATNGEDQIKEKAQGPESMEVTDDETTRSDAVQTTITKEPTHISTPPEKETAETKKPDLRRSTRQRVQNEQSQLEKDKRQTRNATELRDIFQLDSDLIQALVDISLDESYVKRNLEFTLKMRGSSNAYDTDEYELFSPTSDRKQCSWTKVLNNAQEANDVKTFIDSSKYSNSGPADLLLRILRLLSESNTDHFFSTLATLWSSTKDNLHLHLPGSPSSTALVAEAMLSSGKKVGKAKAKRFQEVARLLSNITFSEGESSVLERFLKIRLAWIWSQLHECKGEMQLSFEKAESALRLAKEEKENSVEMTPNIAGPDLSGYSIKGLRSLVGLRLSKLKTARDLEKAEEELQKVRSGDLEAARRIVSILSDSVRYSVLEIGLNQWSPDDLKIDFDTIEELEKWENRFDAEVDFEPRLLVFEDACTKLDDLVGSLACFSFRLRMAIHYYTAQLKCEQEKDYQQAPDEETSGKRLSELLVQVRKFVFIIKRISSSTDESLWKAERGPSKWSMTEAASAAIVTLISLTQLLITKVPAIKGPAPSMELQAGPKNLRLGFTRCMLAFPRCIMIRQKCDATVSNVDKENLDNVGEDGLTVKMLYITSFCLKALASRGCCRGEGTSGALIKLYISQLLKRLQELAVQNQKTVTSQEKNVLLASTRKREKQDSMDEEENKSDGDKLSFMSDDEKDSEASTDSGIAKVQPGYLWTSAEAIRYELSQCFQCLYQIQELDTASSENQTLKGSGWLQRGCDMSRKMGLAFTSGDPTATVAAIDADVSTSVYLYYRKQIFESIYLRRRDGGRIKRLQELLSRLVENIPLDSLDKVSALPRDTLDNILNNESLANSQDHNEKMKIVNSLWEKWTTINSAQKGNEMNTNSKVVSLQYSTLYFEIFIIHTLSLLSVHDSEYKKQKNAERRKRPKEVADRLIVAHRECMTAVRVRPWSVGAWILLGRVLIEMIDLALDERELVLSSFGLYRPDDVILLSESCTVAMLFCQVEACFAFAEGLLEHNWTNEATKLHLDVDAAQVLGYAYDDSVEDPWCGFGDDGDLFGCFGLTNLSTSRPHFANEPHPNQLPQAEEKRRRAAVHFGRAAIFWLRLQEARYYHTHWTSSSLDTKNKANKYDVYSESITKLTVKAYINLKEARSLYSCSPIIPNSDNPSASDIDLTSNVDELKLFTYEKPRWRSDFVNIDELSWYFTMHEAKLMRKLGKAPAEYLAMFRKAIIENESLRKEMKQPADTEPVYKLHAARMRILCSTEENENMNDVLNLLEKYSFGPTKSINLAEGQNVDKDSEDWMAERRISIAEDILSAMQFCSDSKSSQYSEFYYKAVYCKGLILTEVLKDVRGALEELGKIFRVDAAAKVLDQGPDGTHRGYFYKFWSYRITDTGIEPALETDRKLIRWRSKLLGLYAQLLKQTGEWRLLAAIIHRLRRRMSEDLPIDGALLDDLTEAFALTSREAVLKSMEKSIVTDASAFESSFRRTWDIYVETLRLAQGMRRVRVGISREEKNETGGERLVQSNRPRCLMAIHTVLRLEHMRWRSAVDGKQIDISAMKSLPITGDVMQLPTEIRFDFVETLTVCLNKWSLEDKMRKFLAKRIEIYSSEPLQ